MTPWTTSLELNLEELVALRDGFTSLCLWLTLAALVSRSHQHSANYRTKPLEDWRE
jgi:hypothetical protein